MAQGAMAVILILQKVRLYGYRLRRADVHRLNLDTWTSRGGIS